MAIEVRKVSTFRDQRQFFQFSNQLYKNNPYWVAWPASELAAMLDPTQCGFYQRGIAEAWVAYRHRQMVGRIAGSIDATYNKTCSKKTAFFGFYECIDDLKVAEELFRQVEEWAKFHRMEVIQGPFSLSSIYGAGMLVEGFDDRPYVNMPYNLPYYQRQLEALGFKKIKDYSAFRIQESKTLLEKVSKLTCRWNQRITYRDLNPHRLEEESNLVCRLYNEAFAGQWGHVPIEQSEFYQLALDWIKVLDPHFFVFMLLHNNPIGFCLLAPDAFQVLHTIKTPLGLLQHLGQRLFASPQAGITRCRVDTLCVQKKYRSTGLSILLGQEVFQRYLKSNFTEMEISPVLEDNRGVQQLLTKLGAEQSKLYRVFEKPLKL